MSKPWYLAGPMTGYAHFNYPSFIEAAESLRAKYFEVVTPVELDMLDDTFDKAMASVNGDLLESDIVSETWGTMLARDVKIITDDCRGVIFLPGWEGSRGARLEGFVAVLNSHDFARYVGGGAIERMSPQMVLTKITRHTLEDIRNV